MSDSKRYVPLHLHTEYSLLDGAIRLKDYLSFAKKAGWTSLAITDHGNVFGAVKFFQQASKAGIKPILGAEMYFIPDASAPNLASRKYYHLTLLVKDQEGYANLCRLMAFSYQKGFYFKPRIDFEILRQNSKGLILLSGCLGGLVAQNLLENKIEEARENAAKFLEIMGQGNFFLEVMPADSEGKENDERDLVNQRTFDLAADLGLECVATPDSHFLLPEHHNAHEVMLCIGTKNLITDKDRFSFGDFKGHLKTTEEMLAAFPGREEVVWKSGEIADQCTFSFKFGELFFPQYQIPENYTQDSYFEYLCWQGLESIFQKGLVAEEDKQKYKDRLSLEVDLICKMGFVGYFLVVGDFIAWAKKNDIPVGPGRGSAAGSLVAWSLQITNIDPVKYNLLFERFLNPERVSMPDIDIDFCIFGREHVINYVKEKYGQDCVCQIITFGTMAAKGVIKDVARTLGLSFADSQAITDLIPEQLKISLKEAIEQEPLLQNMIESNPKVKEIFEIGFVLEGVTRHASKHAAGVVISPQPLKDVIPLYIPPKTNDLVTQYAMSELEAVGFLKMDFLGLKNLTVIDRTVKSVKRRLGICIDLDTLPVDDEDAFKILGQGKTAGIFQFEGSGVTEVLVKLQPEKFEDLIAVNALYRPGPLGSGMVDHFIEGRHGKREPTYLFEELRPVLSETYGVIVYQEQVMKIASVIAGYTLGGADLLRRAMGKKKPEEMAKQKSVFLEGSAAKNFDQEKADKLFELMAYFAGYGFNKSHSAAYALIAYQTAYLKAHYPKDFVAAILSFETSDPDKLQEYLQKAREVDVKIFPPNINSSDIEFTAVEDGVLFGLSGIKNVGGACLDEILKQRTTGPFVSLLDFCRRVNTRIANKRVLESLIYSGAMDCLPGNRAQKLAKVNQIISKVNAEKEAKNTGQMDIFSSGSTKDATYVDDVSYDPIEEMPLKDLLDKEKEALGFYLSAHPLDEARFEIDLLEKSNLASADHEQFIGKKFFLIGSCVSKKVITTKAGQQMAFVNFEDRYGKVYEVPIFPALFKKEGDAIVEGKIFLIIGVLAKTGDLFKIKPDVLIEFSKFWDSDKSNIALTAYFKKGSEKEALSIFPEPDETSLTKLIVFCEENLRKIKIIANQKCNIKRIKNFADKNSLINFGITFVSEQKQF